VSGRSYLSIGDVLTLLREEFPDVTISKIRFLESQGLVNPERSPSGYRKFYEHDVERLRWVLRQQREHFLPLKVIRDRLADGDLDDTEGYGNGKQSEPAHAAAVARGAGGAHSVSDDAVTRADEEAMARILADASRRAASMPAVAESAPARRGSHASDAGAVAGAVGAEEHPTDPGPGSGVPLVEAAQRGSGRGGQSSGPRHAAAGASGASGGRGGRGSSGASGSGAGEKTGTGAAASRSRAASEAAEPAPPAGGAGRRGQGSSGASGASSASNAPGTAASMVTGASMTADELCAAAGLSPEELAALEGFGLVEGATVAGILTYDEDALTVANLAASFRAFGIEPRHLRLYRNAADREMGLIEQLVIPLLRQRNPESRQRAVESADQLAALGQTMRATLLRMALRRHLGG
jgi:DNA-binding transcriptional MerR regulator